MNGINQVSSPMYLWPAYGRDYASMEVMVADWKAGKDFRIGRYGPYTSIRDLEQLKQDASTIWLETYSLLFRVA